MHTVQAPGTIQDIFAEQQHRFQQVKKEPVALRKTRLRSLRRWIHSHRSLIHQAMYDDFQKNPTEVDLIEIFHVLSEIKYALGNLDQWSAPRKVDAPLVLLGTRSFIQYEARGVCLIISPWNYPFSLCIGPLVSALAAGNVAILKPSEFTPHVSALIKRMAEEVFPTNIVAVVEGGVDVAQELLRMPFHHIFFTGSPAVGKIVMKAAAENLASVTLELGGKSPAIVCDRGSIRDAAERISFAKFLNNGQTCIAPDFVLVQEEIAADFTRALIEETKKKFTQNNEPFENSRHYCRVVNNAHARRLEEVLQEALQAGARVELDGQHNIPERFFHPTILSDVPLDTRLINEEIFGPILPLITYKTLDEAIAFVNEKPKALALYVFSGRKKDQHRVLQETSAGGVCMNDCGIHFMQHNLPFGGVNNSGIGKSHGYFGFLAFSNEKAVLRQRRGWTTTSLFYPPYTRGLARFTDWLLRFF